MFFFFLRFQKIVSGSQHSLFVHMSFSDSRYLALSTASISIHHICLQASLCIHNLILICYFAFPIAGMYLSVVYLKKTAINVFVLHIASENPSSSYLENQFHLYTPRSCGMIVAFLLQVTLRHAGEFKIIWVQFICVVHIFQR